MAEEAGEGASDDVLAVLLDVLKKLDDRGSHLAAAWVAQAIEALTLRDGTNN